jgi:uncharacterized protein YndB with AHSA1/START domain
MADRVMSGHRVEASRLIGVDPTQVFDALMAAALPELFAHRFAAFPAVREVTGEPDDWGTVGQSRTIVMADGGSVRETLTWVDRPSSYAYVLDDIHGRLRPFVSTVDGAWTITPVDSGARVEWAWTMHAQTSPARLTMSVLGRMWKGYAERALAELETILLR